MCGCSATAHHAQAMGLPSAPRHLITAARGWAAKALGMGWADWERAENVARAKVIALYQEQGYRDAWTRQQSAGLESGVVLPPQSAGGWAAG